MKVGRDFKFGFMLLCDLFMLPRWHKKAQSGEGAAATNSIFGEDVLVAAQAVVPGQNSFQAQRDR